MLHLVSGINFHNISVLQSAQNHHATPYHFSRQLTAGPSTVSWSFPHTLQNLYLFFKIFSPIPLPFSRTELLDFDLCFLSCVSMLTRDIDIANLSVRPSVCLSVRCVPVLYENGLTYCHNFFTTWQPNHSSFRGINQIPEIPTGHSQGGAKYRWSIKIWKFSTIKLAISRQRRIQDSAIVTIEGE